MKSMCCGLWVDHDIIFRASAVNVRFMSIFLHVTSQDFYSGKIALLVSLIDLKSKFIYFPQWNFGNMSVFEQLIVLMSPQNISKYENDVNSIPSYLIHWSPLLRLSISLKTEFDIPTVLRTSNAFLWALCTKIINQTKRLYQQLHRKWYQYTANYY